MKKTMMEPVLESEVTAVLKILGRNKCPGADKISIVSRLEPESVKILTNMEVWGMDPRLETFNVHSSPQERKC